MQLTNIKIFSFQIQAIITIVYADLLACLHIQIITDTCHVTNQTPKPFHHFLPLGIRLLPNLQWSNHRISDSPRETSISHPGVSELYVEGDGGDGRRRQRNTECGLVAKRRERDWKKYRPQFGRSESEMISFDVIWNDNLISVPVAGCVLHAGTQQMLFLSFCGHFFFCRSRWIYFVGGSRRRISLLLPARQRWWL